VTVNLKNALQRFRDSSRGRFLWVDAICINQEDVTERTQQVKMMTEIYSRAPSVVIWLGDGDTDTDKAMDVIATLSSLLKTEFPDISKYLMGPNGTEFGISHVARILEKYQFQVQPVESDESAAASLSYLFGNPWFRRIWVLQEVARSWNTLVISGGKQVYWGELLFSHVWQNTFHKIPGPNGGIVERQHSITVVPTVWLSFAENGTSKRLHFFELCLRTREFRSTDPRDKIFGILALAEETWQIRHLPLELQPNYAKRAIEVYCDFTYGLIRLSKSLELLSAVDPIAVESALVSGKPLYSTLPSWVPTLTEGRGIARIFGYLKLYNAAGDTAAVPRSLDQGKTLILNGTRFTRVQHISPTFEEVGFQPKQDNMVGLIAVWAAFLKFTRSNPECPYADNLITTFIQTLTCCGFSNASAFRETIDSLPFDRILRTSLYPLLEADFASYWQEMDPSFRAFTALPNDRSRLQEQCAKGRARSFWVLLGNSIDSRRFFFTPDGYFGLGPSTIEPGDLVCILYGGDIPYILRENPVHRDDVEPAPALFTFIGECYVHGVMDGE
ncbi:hypothetical protein K432DRAFT_281275, partial [Lepidopterella palustris CBS 459.81]